MPDDEVKMLLRQVLDILPTLATKADLVRVESSLRTDIAALQAGQAGLQTDVTALQAGQAGLQTNVAALQTGQTELQTNVAELQAGQNLILQHLDVAELKGRVEEQSRTIASLIPTRVAAVGGRQ